MADEDLDELLLQVTGTNANRKKRSSTADENEDSSDNVYEGDKESSDGGNDEEADIGDSDNLREDEDSDYGGSSAKDRRKAVARGSRSKKRKKKEIDEDIDWREDADHTDDEPSEFEDEFDESLRGDEEDRRNLAKMSELDREAVLAERHEKRQRKREQWELRRKLKNQKRSKKSDIAQKKRDEKIKADKRAKKAAVASLAAEKKRAMGSPAFDSDAESHGMSDDMLNEGQDLEEDDSDTEGPPLRYEDLVNPSTRETTRLYVRRDTLSKWVREAFFDKLVPGLFVKISVGENPDAPGIQVYRLCRIRKVIETSVSKRISFGGQYTNKRLELAFGHLKGPFDMTLVSNHSPTEQEFKRWVRQVDQDSIPLPSRAELHKLTEHVRQILMGEIKPTEEELRKHQENYEKVNPERINRVAKKKELSMKLRAAQDKQDENSIADLKTRLKLIEDVDEKLRMKQEQKKAAPSITHSSALLRMKAVKNKAENDKKDQIAAIRRSEGVDDNMKSFLRLESSGQSYFSIKKNKSSALERLASADLSNASPELKKKLSEVRNKGERPPLSARYDVDVDVLEVFEEYWKSATGHGRKYLPPGLDARARVRQVPLSNRKVVSFSDFEKQMRS